MPIEEYCCPSQIFEGAPVEPSTFVFLDYMQWCWGYAVDLRSSRVYMADSTPLLIASTIDEFLDLYIHDDRRLYPPSGAG